MQSSRTWLTCHAHNRFAPSTTLWQHLVAPAQCLGRQQRLLSSVDRAPHTNAGSKPASANSDEPREKKAWANLRYVLGKKTEAAKIAHIPRELPWQARSAHVPRRVVAPRMSLEFSTKRVPVPKPDAVPGAESENASFAAIVAKFEALLDTRQAQLQEPRKLLSVAKAAFQADEDYEAFVIAPMQGSKTFPEAHLPWCLPPEKRDMPGLDRCVSWLHELSQLPADPCNRLAAEIKRFSEYARPNRFDEIARRHLMERVRQAVVRRIPKWNLEVFGSQSTGIALATSDIDFRMMDSLEVPDPALAKLPPRPVQRRRGQRVLLSYTKGC